MNFLLSSLSESDLGCHINDDAVKVPVGTLPPFLGSEALGASQVGEGAALSTGIHVSSEATPGAGEMPGSSGSVQGTQEPPVELLAPDADSEIDNLTCGQRFPSTQSSSPHDSSFDSSSPKPIITAMSDVEILTLYDAKLVF